MHRKPRVLLGVVDLRRITGGITVLARLVYRTLGEMDREGLIKLQVQVLNEARPIHGSDISQEYRDVAIRWCGGTRVHFELGVLTSRPDLAIFDHAGPARTARILPKPTRPHYCVFIHGVEVAEQSRAEYTKALKGARLLIANSYYTKLRAERLGVPLPDIKVCWPGIERAPTHVDVTGLPIDIGPHALLIVGRMATSQRHKGHDQLIECMPQILKRVPGARLIIAGDGDDVERLKQKAKSSGVGNQVLFMGRVSNEILQALYKKCAIFAMPSKGDGFGFVYLEAMSHSKPCVGLVDGAAAEIIQHGKTGLLVDRNKKDEMANAISELLLAPEGCKQMGKAGFDRLHNMFLREHFDRRLRAAIGEVLM